MILIPLFPLYPLVKEANAQTPLLSSNKINPGSISKECPGNPNKYVFDLAMLENFALRAIQTTL